MKKMMNYNTFFGINDNTLNESNKFMETLDKIFNYFKNKFKTPWLYFMLFLQKTGRLKKLGVELYVPYSVKGHDIKNIDDDSLLPESVKFNTSRKPFFLNEAEVTLKSLDMNKPNVNSEELAEQIYDLIAENEDRIEENEERGDNTTSLFIWGAPGIGKTSIVKQVAKKTGMIVETMLLSQYSPEDFKGVPTIENIKGSDNKDDERTVWKLPKSFPTDDGPNGKGGILFFDEMNQSNKIVLGAAMTLCLDGIVGDYKLPEHWIIVAAGNRKEDVGRGGMITQLSKPLAGRFSHVNFAPDKQDFISHVLKRKDMNPDVIGFIEFQPQWLFKLDSDEETELYASPRNWVKASHADYIKRGKNWSNKLNTNKLRLIYSKLVGDAAASAFLSYVELRDYFDEKDVKDVYKIGINAKPLPKKRPDVARAAVIAIALYKKGEDLTLDEFDNLLEYVKGQEFWEVMTSLLNYLSYVRPELKTDSRYRDKYLELIKIWHKKKQELGIKD